MKIYLKNEFTVVEFEIQKIDHESKMVKFEVRKVKFKFEKSNLICIRF